MLNEAETNNDNLNHSISYFSTGYPFGKINLDEGGAERTVTLESTIPLLCTNLIFASECKLQVKLAALTNPAGTFFDFLSTNHLPAIMNGNFICDSQLLAANS